MLERQIDGDTDQRRREDDCADLGLECVLVVWIIVQLNASYVTYCANISTGRD